MFLMRSVLPAVLLSFFASIASAALITFDTSPVAFQQGYGDGTQYVEGDFFISSTSTPGAHGGVIRFNPDAQRAIVPNNGTIHMGATYFSNPWLQRVDGGVFDFLGLDLAEYSEYVMTRSVDIRGIFESGAAVTRTFTLDRLLDGAGGVNDFQHFNLDWTNLVRVDFLTYGFAMDNLVVFPSAVVSVSEPSSLAILLIGIFGLVLRKQANTR